MIFLRNRQDKIINNYILLSEIILLILSGIIVLNYSTTNFYNYFSKAPLTLFNIALILILVISQKSKATGYKLAGIIELAVCLGYFIFMLLLIRYEFQYLYKIILIMPVIILSLRYGLRMAYLFSIGTIFYLAYLHNFATLNADIILSGINLLVAWLLGQMTETQYSIRSKLELENASRKQAEKELKNQLRFLQNLIDTIPNPIYYTNLNYVFTGCNKAFEDFFSISRNDIINCKTIWNVLPLDVAQKLINFNMFTEEENESNESVEFTISNSKGEFREVIFNNVFFQDNDAKIIGLLSVILDITEQKNFQKEIARVDRINLVGEMAAGIAHEIRNPIATVKGFLQLYQINSNITTLDENIDLMINELNRANSIITDYLSLAKGRALKLEPKNLNNVISSIGPLISADATMTDKFVEFSLGDIPDTLLDEDQIRQMLLNLCRNGLEAMENGGILTVSTLLLHPYIILKIRDQGKGIDPQIQDKIGTPFVTDKEQGTGLGLAVCYSIAARHNASITYDTGSKGTTFYIKFKV